MVMVHTVAHITITTVVMMTRLSIAILSPTSYAVVAPKPVAPESARPAVRGRFAAVLAVVVRARPVYSLTAKSVRAVVFLQRRRLNFLCVCVCVCVFYCVSPERKERKKERKSERESFESFSMHQFPKQESFLLSSRSACCWIFDISGIKKKRKKKRI
jgi:hypothetical protein